jgi:transposase InsO family protein
MKNMAYTQNPHLPKVRRDAADLVHRGWGIRQVARYVGVSPGTITKWVKKAIKYGHHPIPTLSSKPKHHPNQLSDDLVWKIFHKRLAVKRCAEVVHQELINEEVFVSLSSVKRTLDRLGLLKKRSPWKRYRIPMIRPNIEKQGDLVQVDTIHLPTREGRIYVFTLLDVYSRWAYARAYKRATARTAKNFVGLAQSVASFPFKVIQSDNGSEFGGWFSDHINSIHRHSRVRRPNDNAHLERFNRTIQEECIDRIPKKVEDLNVAIKKYIQYYNEKRLHMGLKLHTPLQVLTTKCFQAID